MSGYNKAVEDVTGDYGFDRIIWVLASVMAKDTENIATAKHKDWLSVVELPNEPLPDYDIKCNAALSTFITQFQEYRRTFLARQAWEQEQTRSLSMADRLAVAKEKADEHNVGREIPNVAKPKRNRGMDR